MLKLAKRRFSPQSPKQMRRVDSAFGAHIATAAKRARQATAPTLRSAPLSRVRKMSTKRDQKAWRILKHPRMDQLRTSHGIFVANQIRKPCWKRRLRLLPNSLS